MRAKPNGDPVGIPLPPAVAAPRRRPPGAVWLLAVLISALTLAARLGLSPWFGDRPVLILFVLPIFLSAYIGGLGPGLAATAMAAMGTSYFLIPPLHSFAMGRSVDSVQWLLLIVAGVLISILTETRLKSMAGEPANRHRLFSTERKVQAGFAFALTCLGVIGVMSFTSVTRLSEDADRTRHTEEVIAALHLLLSTATDAETAQRGYAITGDESFLQPYEDARRRIAADLVELRSLTADNPGQQRQMEALARLVGERLDETVKTVELRRSQGFDAAQAAIASGRGKLLHDRIRAIIGGMDAAEQSLLKQRAQATQRTATLTHTIITAGSALAFGCVAVALFAAGRDFAGSRRAEVALREAKEQLEARVAERTAELQEQRAELQVILDTVPALIFYKDRAHRLIRVNRELAQMMERTREELEGCSNTELGSPDAEQYHRDEDEVMATGQPKRQIIESLVTPGGIRWLQTDKIPRRDETGKIVGIIGFSMDITERKRAEEALRESEELFAKSFRLSPDCVAIVRMPDRIVIRANDALCELWGIAPDEVIGHPTQEYTSWLSEDERLAFMRTLQETGECLSCDTKLRVPDGRAVDFNISSRMITFNGESCVLSVMRDITERKRSEVVAAHLAAIVESSDDAIIGEDLSGIITSWNAGAEKIYGYTAGEMVGRPVALLIPSERQAEETEILDHIRRGESVRDFDTVRARKDGRTLDVSVSVSAIRDRAGKIVGASKMARDISERKRIAEALLESEGRLRGILDTMFVFVGLMNLDGQIVEVNLAPLEAAGLKREEVMGRTVAESYWFSYSPAVQEQVCQALARAARGEVIRDDYLIRIAEGALITIDTTFAPLRDAHGRITQIVGSAVDITERKRAEQAVRESEEYFHFLNDLTEATRTLADPAQIMAVTARMLGGNLRASRCAYADVEPDGEQFTIRHDYTDGCASTVGQYQLSLFGPRAVATLHGGQTLIIRDVAAELLPGEGADMFNAIGIQAIITCPLVKEGGLRAMMAVHQAAPRDWQPGEITLVQEVVERCWATIERRTAEEKIHQLNAGLEQRVIERTAQLESANKELEAFSYSVSHDLRAPLRAVDGFSQAVLEDYGPQLPEAGQRYLRTIREGAQRMGVLIDDLLTFSRLSRLPLKRQTVDTQRQVRETLDELKAEQSGRALEIRLGELPPCEGDPVLLKQVWVNLLSNAFKYTGKRAQAVVEIGATRKPTATVYFVRDNGTGFDMRYAAKLFGVFQRLHRQEEFDGNGVGLAIVQRIVHRHGGRVWAEAALDRGATFYFTLEGETEL